MPHAILNMRNYSNGEKNSFRHSNGARLAGIIFFLSLLSGVFISISMAFSWMKDVQRFPLSKLILVGKRYYTQNDDIRQAILELGPLGTFITQDISLIKTQIQRLPWIKQVSVRKHWPDKLMIYLVEYVPAAYWNDQNMLDVDGKSFSAPRHRGKQKKLPNLYGPEGSGTEVMEGFRKIEKVVIQSHFRLKEAAMTARRSWQLVFTNGIKLNLGRDNTIKRITRFLELYPVLQQKAERDGKRISYVDLRYDSGAAVGWESTSLDELNQKQLKYRHKYRQNNND